MIKKATLDLLEFNKLLKIISVNANCDASQEAVLNILPLNDRADIERRFGQISEIRRMSSEDTPLKLSKFTDISRFIIRVRPEGAVLEASELSAFIPVLDMATEISSQMIAKDGFPFLRELTDQLTGQPDILKKLKKSVDREGNILDSASSALASLRKDIRRLESGIQKRLEEMTRDSRISIFLQDDFITKRAGRWVIPVRMDSKGQVPGVVHDVSKSGETAFIEPLGIINLSNELENLIAEEKAEEIRILRALSSEIRNRADEIDKEYKILVYLDVLNCLSKFADIMKMQIPQISESGAVYLVKARHPLLMLALQKTGSDQKVVPLDIKLGEDNNVMVITGSNAGGKTIAIKTIGLLMIMALSGMPVPADSASVFPLTGNLLIDIGDEQSIENSLSTFSAHVSNISEIITNADSQSLVLIDELGTGTDPDEGAALSCAVLKELQKSRALVFATTHLTGIKGFVHRTAGMINASMEFDQKTLTPLYKLRIGEPGQSHALEIAKKYGLPDSIIDTAREMLGGMTAELDNLIADLNEKRAYYEKAIEGLSRRQSEIDDRQRLLGQKISETEAKQKEILSNAYKEASDIISDIKRQMYAKLDEIKKMDKQKIRESIKRAEVSKKLMDEKIRQYVDTGEAPGINEIREGDIVFVRSLGYDATVVEVVPKYNRLRVIAGSKEIEVPVTDIEVRHGRPLPSKTDIKEVRPDELVPSRINLIGMRVDEALSRLEPFLNHAALAGFNEITVIHGIGKGLLSRAVREHLEGHPLVKKFRTGEQSEGGGGVTIVTLV